MHPEIPGSDNKTKQDIGATHTLFAGVALSYLANTDGIIGTILTFVIISQGDRKGRPYNQNFLDTHWLESSTG